MAEPTNGNGNGVRQLIGETNGMVKMILEQHREFKTALSDQARDLKSELRNIKHEQRQVDQMLVTRLDMLDEKAKRQDAMQNDLAAARAEVAALREPVDQLNRLRQKITQWGVFALAIITFVWWVIGPAAQAMVARWLKL